jgi:hypothetical protein
VSQWSDFTIQCLASTGRSLHLQDQRLFRARFMRTPLSIHVCLCKCRGLPSAVGQREEKGSSIGVLIERTTTSRCQKTFVSFRKHRQWRASIANGAPFRCPQVPNSRRDKSAHKTATMPYFRRAATETCGAVHALRRAAALTSRIATDSDKVWPSMRSAGSCFMGLIAMNSADSDGKGDTVEGLDCATTSFPCGDIPANID